MVARLIRCSPRDRLSASTCHLALNGSWTDGTQPYLMTKLNREPQMSPSGFSPQDDSCLPKYTTVNFGEKEPERVSKASCKGKMKGRWTRYNFVSQAARWANSLLGAYEATAPDHQVYLDAYASQNSNSPSARTPTLSIYTYTPGSQAHLYHPKLPPSPSLLGNK